MSMSDANVTAVMTTQGADAMPAGLWKGPSALTLGVPLPTDSVFEGITDGTSTV